MNRSEVERRLRALRIAWEGNDRGLEPVLEGGGSDWADPGDAQQLGALIAALEEPALFVTAHVVLTQITGVRHAVFPEWNGLRVVLRADGSIEIDPAQRGELARRWRRWAAQVPRPAELPR